MVINRGPLCGETFSGPIEDAAAAMAQASTHISEWDEALIRQLVDTVKVNSAEKITVFLRGGVQVEQGMI